MASLAMAIPILPGKTEEVRKMFKTIKEEKWREYDTSQRQAGIKRERDFLQPTPAGDFVIMYMESDDFNKTFTEFGMSKDPFDVWIREEVKKTTGFDFSQPPSGPLPEQLLQYDS